MKILEWIVEGSTVSPLKYAPRLEENLCRLRFHKPGYKNKVTSLFFGFSYSAGVICVGQNFVKYAPVWYSYLPNKPIGSENFSALKLTRT